MSLNPDHLRTLIAAWGQDEAERTPRFGDDLRADGTNPQRQPSAVMVILLDTGSDISLVLTQRAAHLPKHPGQISFPGGRAEPEDADLLDTARRETREEVGWKSRAATYWPLCRAMPHARAMTWHLSWRWCGLRLNGRHKKAKWRRFSTFRWRGSSARPTGNATARGSGAVHCGTGGLWIWRADIFGEQPRPCYMGLRNAFAPT